MISSRVWGYSLHRTERSLRIIIIIIKHNKNHLFAIVVVTLLYTRAVLLCIRREHTPTEHLFSALNPLGGGTRRSFSFFLSRRLSYGRPFTGGQLILLSFFYICSRRRHRRRRRRYTVPVRMIFFNGRRSRRRPAGKVVVFAVVGRDAGELGRTLRRIRSAFLRKQRESVNLSAYCAYALGKIITSRSRLTETSVRVRNATGAGEKRDGHSTKLFENFFFLFKKKNVGSAGKRDQKTAVSSGSVVIRVRPTRLRTRRISVRNKTPGLRVRLCTAYAITYPNRLRTSA